MRKRRGHQYCVASGISKHFCIFFQFRLRHASFLESKGSFQWVVIGLDSLQLIVLWCSARVLLASFFLHISYTFWNRKPVAARFATVWENGACTGRERRHYLQRLDERLWARCDKAQLYSRQRDVRQQTGYTATRWCMRLNVLSCKLRNCRTLVCTLTCLMPALSEIAWTSYVLLNVCDFSCCRQPKSGGEWRSTLVLLRQMPRLTITPNHVTFSILACLFELLPDFF